MRQNSLIITLLLFCTLGVNGQASLGGGLTFGTDLEEPGIQINADFEVADRWSVSPNLTYWFEGIEDFSLLTLNGDVHYVVNPNASFKVSPFTGLNLQIANDSRGDRYDDTDAGLNLGVGGKTKIGGNAKLYAETKYVISGIDELVLTLGVLFGL